MGWWEDSEVSSTVDRANRTLYREHSLPASDNGRLAYMLWWFQQIWRPRRSLGILPFMRVDSSDI